MSDADALARAERFARMLNDAEDLRTLADYAEAFVVTKEDARTTRRDAEAFVERGAACSATTREALNEGKGVDEEGRADGRRRWAT